MRADKKEALMKLIEGAELISFDVFDTLVFRKVNTPETVFDLLGKRFGIHGFRKLRVDGQNEASRRVYATLGYPHADMNEIYDVLAEHHEIPVDWSEVKACEIQMEKDALVPNDEMLEIFRYAKSRGKRVVATSDMYLLARTIKEILERCGYEDIDKVYCSADEHKAKFNKLLFECVAQKENVPYEKILHIGDKQRDDVDTPSEYGIKAYLYERDCDMEKVQQGAASDIDNGLYKILHDGTKDFWYDLGVEAGGPLYMGLYLWLEEKIKNSDRKVFFLARDGYNLYKLFSRAGYTNVEYLYTSRRSMLLANITEMNEADIRQLPPFTFGQTIAEILGYLCIRTEDIRHLEQAGFKGFGDVIRNHEDIVKFKKLYTLDKEVFLERCALERKYALQYFKSTGFLNEESIVFDCGWSGSSQILLDKFKKVAGCKYDSYYYYFGILNRTKSREQMHGKLYETYAFNYFSNYALQSTVNEAVVMYELFFSAPHESVYYYGSDGPVLEEGKGDWEKQRILDGISDYLREGLGFARKYGVEYTPEVAIGHLKRLVEHPTEREAVMIGNLRNVDGFARQEGVDKRIAWVTREQFEANPNIEIYWMQGFLKRSDVPEQLKRRVARQRGFVYPPAPIPEYHLEDEQSIANYHRWLAKKARETTALVRLKYRPLFSVVIPVYNTRTDQLKAAIDSVLNQSYKKFELILVDDHSSWDNVVPVLKSYEDNPHVTVIYRQVNGHISVATNDGLKEAKGDFVAFMDCDDVIERDALYYMAEKLNENPELDFIYSDEDKITEDGKIRHMPFFKPDWSPDLFMVMMYTNHLAIYRTSIVKELKGLRSAYNGAQDYDFTLRFMDKTENTRVGHIPKVLYHWRERRESVAFAMSSKNYALEAVRLAKEDALRRRGIDGRMEAIYGISQYRVVYNVSQEPRVSIVIPSKDHLTVLKQCIESIRRITQYCNYEIIVVDNGSKDEKEIAGYLQKQKARYCYGKYEFNFSYMCNLGAREATGEYLLFLNDDVEVLHGDWLTRMVGQAMQPHIGAVGAKLLYPNSTVIQHAGITNGSIGPSHSFLRLDDSVAYNFAFNWMDYNCGAVTGACLLVQKDVYVKIGGFDESLPVAYNDVDLCLRIMKTGLYNVVRNDVVLHHYESLSRGNDEMDSRKAFRLSREMQALYAKNPDYHRRDPFLNLNLDNYCNVLSLVDKCAPVERVDLSEAVIAGQGYLDALSTGDNIRFWGWSMLPTMNETRAFSRYIVWVDAYGLSVRAPVSDISRPDVARSTGRGDDQRCGFECVVDRNAFHVDSMRYDIYIETLDDRGNAYLTRLVKHTEINPLSVTTMSYTDCRKEERFIMRPETMGIIWALDEIRDYDEGYLIRGWSFCGGRDHYLYRREILLRDDEGNAYLVEALPEQRLDVAQAYPQIPFLYNVGFDALVYGECLQFDTSYEIIIRSINVLDEREVHDVATGKRIER